MMQVGVASLHVLSALQVRITDVEMVYPVLQLKVTTD